MRNGKFSRRFFKKRWKRSHSSDLTIPSGPADLVALIASLSDVERIIVKLQQRGSENKEKGTEFERAYAVEKIVAAAVKWYVLASDRAYDPRETFFDATLPLLMDDLVIRYSDGRIVVSQVKDWQTSPWDVVVRHCLRQITSARRARMHHRLRCEIVVSRADVHQEMVVQQKADAKMRLARRSRMRRVSNDLEMIKLVHFTVNDARLAINAAPLMTVSAEERTSEEFAEYVYRAWISAGRKGNLYDLMESVSRKSSYHIRSLDPDDMLPTDIERLLRAIPGLVPTLESGRLHLQCGGLTKIMEYKFGSPRWEKFAMELRLARPTDSVGLRELIKRT